MKQSIQENTLLIRLDKHLYHEDIIFKCFYWYSAAFNVNISNGSPDEFEISLVSRQPLTDWNEVTEKIQRDLIDFKLRDIVTKETIHIRELIIAKAFAYFDLVEDPLPDDNMDSVDTQTQHLL